MTRTPGSARGAAGNDGPYRDTSQGHAHARFRRALRAKNVNLIEAAARELQHVGLDDALRVVVVFAARRRGSRPA
jgi:hypothetical protein